MDARDRELMERAMKALEPFAKRTDTKVLATMAGLIKEDEAKDHLRARDTLAALRARLAEPEPEVRAQRKAMYLRMQQDTALTDVERERQADLAVGHEEQMDARMARTTNNAPLPCEEIAARLAPLAKLWTEYRHADPGHDAERALLAIVTCLDEMLGAGGGK